MGAVPGESFTPGKEGEVPPAGRPRSESLFEVGYMWEKGNAPGTVEAWGPGVAGTPHSHLCLRGSAFFHRLAAEHRVRSLRRASPRYGLVGKVWGP